MSADHSWLAVQAWRPVFSCLLLFFHQNERLGYIQSNWQDGKTLESFVQEHSLTGQEIQKLSLGVVQAVCDLHRRNCVHGEISPLSIVVHENLNVTLLVPDFSKTLVSYMYVLNYYKVWDIKFQCLKTCSTIYSC